MPKSWIYSSQLTPIQLSQNQSQFIWLAQDSTTYPSLYLWNCMAKTSHGWGMQHIWGMSCMRMPTWILSADARELSSLSLSIRETFKFANEEQVLKAVQTYCCDFYGSMLWNLYGEQAGQFYRCWNTCTKLSWELPRSTHTFFVDNLLSCGFPSIRQQVINRYIKFFRSLLASPSKEVAVIARIVAMNASSNTGANLLNIKLETNLSSWSAPLFKFKDVIFRPSPIPDQDRWRLSLLPKYIDIRKKQLLDCSDTEFIDNLIESLCSS